MRKIINSASTQYEPLLTEELVLDDHPISGSFNGITSDAVYKAISVDPGNVPPVESTDNGKVLTASYGEGGGSFEWAEAQGGATYTAGNGINISNQNVITSKTSSSDFVYGQTEAIPSSNYASNNSFWYPVDGDGRSAPSTIKCIRDILIGYGNYTLHWVTGSAGQAYVSTFSLDVRYGVTVGNVLTLPNSSRSSDWVGGVAPAGVNPIYLTVAGSTGGTAPNGEEVVALRADASTPYFVAFGNPTTMYLKNPLPASAIGDAGKVLTVNGSGAAAWATPSAGGASMVEVTNSNTYAEVVAILNAGNIPFRQYKPMDDDIVIVMIGNYSNTDSMYGDVGIAFTACLARGISPLGLDVYSMHLGSSGWGNFQQNFIEFPST